MAEQSQTKQCKYCKTEIPADAKVCPNCKKRQQPSGCLIALIVVIVVVVLIGIIGGGTSGGGASTGTAQTAPSSSTPPAENAGEEAAEATPAPTAQPEATTYGVGELAEKDGIEVTMLTAEENAGANYMYPNEGNIFVASEFEIVNNSDADIAISSMLCFTAYCDDYAVDQSYTGATLYSDKGTLDGTVAPGKRLNGVIVYEVPQDWAKLEIVFTPSAWGDRSLTFELTNAG